MMTTALLLGVFADVTFGGGNLNDFASHLWEQNKVPVAIASYKAATIPKFQYGSDSDSRARAARSMAKLIQPPGLTLAFYHEDFLRNMIFIPPVANNFPSQFESTFKTKPVFEQGVVTIRMSGQEGQIGTQIDKLPWSKPLKVHWVMDRFAVFVHCEQSPEQDVLNAIAKASACRLKVRPKEYTMQLDGAEFKRRAANLLQRFEGDAYFKGRHPNERNKLNLLSFAVRTASAKDFETAFATPNSEVGIPLDQGGKGQLYQMLGTAAKEARGFQLAQVNAREQTAELKAPVSASGGLADNFLRMADWNGNVILFLTSTFEVRVEATSRVSRGEAQTIMFEFPSSQAREW